MLDQKSALETTKNTLQNAINEKSAHPSQKKMLTMTLPAEVTLTDNKRNSIDKRGASIPEIYNGRVGNTSGVNATSSLESDGNSEATRSDLDAIVKKIPVIEKKMLSVASEAKKKGKEVAEIEQEINEKRQHCDLFQSQMKDLGEQLNMQIRQVYKDVGEQLTKASSLSINMYNFL